jgi:predicted membrane chloride channel (bestrophin family)
MRMISPQLFALMAWASLVSYGAPSVVKYPLFTRFSVLKLPLTPLSLVSGFVAGLLTLRTNNALTRLFTGRQTWGRIMSLNRDLAQQIATYIYPYDEQLGLLCARHLAIFGMLTKTRFRDEKDNDITDAALSSVDAAYVQSQRKKAPACIQRIRQVVATMAGKVRNSNVLSRVIQHGVARLI